MMLEMLQAKLHKARVSDCQLTYRGSLTVDQDLIDTAGMRVNQKVQVVNCNNGARFETYLIAGERGSGDIVVNGAAARLAEPDDLIIVISYAHFDESELEDHEPRVVLLDEDNRVTKILAG